MEAAERVMAVRRECAISTADRGEVGARERQHLLDEIDAIAARGALSREQRDARERIAAAPVAPPLPDPAAPPQSASPATGRAA